MSARAMTRRSVLLGGCVAAALSAVPATASASLLRPARMPVDGPAPRPTCAHEGCRFWRASGSAAEAGVCGLARGGQIAVLEPEAG